MFSLMIDALRDLHDFSISSSVELSFVVKLSNFVVSTLSSKEHSIQGRPQDLRGGGAKNFIFQIWKFACREATCCAWLSHALC